MHPVLILIPAVALVLGPELLVQHMLRRYNREDEDSLNCTGGELARELLDRYQLRSVKVESTDLGDHYDPETKTVRLTRDKIDRKTLAAITSAAHEVAHALQDAHRYPPFIWRTHVTKFSQITGKVGSALVLATPIAALVSRSPVPPIVIGTTAIAILGSGVLAQAASLPSELDASFHKALPLLRGYIDRDKEKSVRTFLMASILTYITSSLTGVVGIWRWLPTVPGPAAPHPPSGPQPAVSHPPSGTRSATSQPASSPHPVPPPSSSSVAAR